MAYWFFLLKAEDTASKHSLEEKNLLSIGDMIGKMHDMQINFNQHKAHFYEPLHNNIQSSTKIEILATPHILIN